MTLRIFITPKRAAVDAPGRTTLECLHQLRYLEAERVVLGRLLEINFLRGVSEDDCRKMIEDCSRRQEPLFPNSIMEDWKMEIVSNTGKD